MFFSLLKRIAATERPFEVQRGSLGFLGGGGQRRKTVLAISSKKICPKCIFLGTSGVIWGDLRTFWSDFSDFRMQNSFCQIRKRVLACRALHVLHFVHL